MTMLQRCQRYLKQHNIRYAHSIHPPAFTARDIASADRVAAHKMTKVVVYFGGNGYGMLVLPADCVVDFAEVRRLLGLPDIRLAAEAELLGLFPDCEVGAMPPFGNIFSLPVLVDERIAISEFIAFNAGTHKDVIRMSFSDFAGLVNPLVAGFAASSSRASPNVVHAAK